ncbi:E3 ubiquitin ligase [Phaffia rhodozyma]|uniref:RING-type E3 ubiquitin transferase n=1 Tax=Phaffia rhodozyma TaxID=264483 RepID=A0A0F7SQK2_PHARH|nr:E3 ubiquitin ligase [Phaffia rhodozyma]
MAAPPQANHFLARLVPSSNRLLLYGATSTALAASVLLNAAQTRSSFYAAAVGIAKSNGSVMVLANFCLFVSLMIGIGFQRLFFGRLRPIEVEHLYDRSWYFLTESLLALAMFREDFDTTFVLLFGGLLFLKCFHWIAADRVEWMDQLPPPGPPLLFHIRLVALLGPFLFMLDTLLLMYAISSIFTYGLSGKLLFVNEFAVLLTNWANIVGRYNVNLWDQWKSRRIRRDRERARLAAVARGEENAEDEDDGDEDETWEGKSMVVFYIDLVTDFIKLLTYLTFFVLILTYYGLPFNILRDVYMTMRSFVARIRTLFQYRAATRNMEARYPDATREEMDRMDDKVCIICREEMVWQPPAGQEDQAQDPTETGAAVPPRRRRVRRDGERPKKLGCGHVFHLNCLKSWLERQQNCPTCRRTVLNQTPVVPAAPGAVPALAGAQPTPIAPPNILPRWPHPTQPHLHQHPHAPTPTQPAPAQHPLPPNGEGGLFAGPVPPPRFAHQPHPAAYAGYPPLRVPHLQAHPQTMIPGLTGVVPGPDGRRPLAGFEVAGFGWGMGVRFGAQVGNPAAGQLRRVVEEQPAPVTPQPPAQTQPQEGWNRTASAPSAATAPTLVTPLPADVPSISASTSDAPVDPPSDGSSNPEGVTTSGSDEQTMTPREIAAQAALRRSARLNPSLSTPPKETCTTVVGEQSVIDEPELSHVPSIPLETTSYLPSVEGSSSTTIPLSSPSEATTPGSAKSYLPQQQQHHRQQGPTLTPLHPTPSLSYLDSSLRFPFFSNPSRINEPPPSRPTGTLELPERLTEDELDRMDRLTREAIQDRLSFIGRIDQVLTGLREELGRVEERLARPRFESRNDPESGREMGAREIPLPRDLDDEL